MGGPASSTIGQISDPFQTGWGKAAEQKIGMGPKSTPQQDMALNERNRLKGLLTEDNMSLLTKEDIEKYKSRLNLQQGQIAPQDELGYYKSAADELEALVSTQRERQKITMEQQKLLLETPGAKQLRNADYILQAAVKNPESILTAGQAASGNAKKGTILT